MVRLEHVAWTRLDYFTVRLEYLTYSRLDFLLYDLSISLNTTWVRPDVDTRNFTEPGCGLTLLKCSFDWFSLLVYFDRWLKVVLRRNRDYLTFSIWRYLKIPEFSLISGVNCEMFDHVTFTDRAVAFSCVLVVYVNGLLSLVLILKRGLWLAVT